MIILVRCKCCMTEYRLDEGLLKGAKGACIRCPKCRERIIVENPQAAPAAPAIGHRVQPPVALQLPPRVAPPVAAPTSPPKVPPTAPSDAREAGIPPIRAAEPKRMHSPVPRDRRAEGADLSGRIRSDPVAGFDERIDVSPAAETGSDPLNTPGDKALRMEDLFISSSEAEKNRKRTREDDGPMAIRSPGPGWNPPPRRPRNRRPLYLAAMISILLLAGGAFYFVDGNFDRTSSGDVILGQARSAPENPDFDVRNLKGFLSKQASGEPIYIVKGTVTSVGKALSSGIRIETTLLGRDNQEILKKGSFAGNVIDESLISHMSRVRIEGFLGMRYGEGDLNRDIPTGKTLPFMVVFFDPPEGVVSFRVKAIDAEEADRINSPEGKEPAPGHRIHSRSG